MKMKNTLSKINSDSSHYTVGLNTFSIMANLLLWAHLTGHLTWWALPLTVIAVFIGFGNEIQARKPSKNTITL